MYIKYICFCCQRVQFSSSHRKIDETVTKEVYKCVCKCGYENNVIIYKPEQFKLPFDEKPNQRSDVI